MQTHEHAQLHPKHSYIPKDEEERLLRGRFAGGGGGSRRRSSALSVIISEKDPSSVANVQIKILQQGVIEDIDIDANRIKPDVASAAASAAAAATAAAAVAAAVSNDSAAIAAVGSKNGGVDGRFAGDSEGAIVIEKMGENEKGDSIIEIAPKKQTVRDRSKDNDEAYLNDAHDVDAHDAESIVLTTISSDTSTISS